MKHSLQSCEDKFHFSFMLKLMLITVWFRVSKYELFLHWHVLRWHSRNDSFNRWTPAKHSSVCLHSSSSVIFLQRVLSPLPHKSLLYVHKIKWIHNSDIFRVDGTLWSRVGNLRDGSLCFLDPWGQGQEVSRRTVRHTGAKVLRCWKNDARDALVFLPRRSFSRIVHNSSNYWWQARTE